MENLTILNPKLEAELPEQIQLIRKFYFQLSEEDKKKLDQIKIPTPEHNAKDTKFCYECGQKITRSAKFCEYCGTKQTETQQHIQQSTREPTIQEIYSKENLQLSDDVDDFIQTEKVRLLKKYNCNTMGEVIKKLEQSIKEKHKKN